ncbi:MAG: histidinol-phosphate transaminase [candidate division KSB1 bacterium]|nr:histidinol-phosphate transaminase [candidate division KSB1 bacterium]
MHSPSPFAMKNVNWNSLIKPEVLAIAGYHLAKHEYVVKLDQNENPFGVPEPLREEILRRLRARDWSRYPDFQMQRLTERIAAYAGALTERVVVGNGSNSLIQALFWVVLAPGDRMIVTEPTFSLYAQFARMLGAEVRTCRLQPETFALPLEALRREIREPRAKMLVLCSPNNPTGNQFSLTDIETLISEFDGLVVLDEAYREFSEQDALALLERYENLLLLRTFSKAFALAGLRIGYLLGAPALCEQVKKARVPYSVNLMAETAAEVCLDHLDILQQQIRDIIRLRQELLEALAPLKRVRAYPSDANFVLIRTDEPRRLFQFLLEDGILVRDVTGYPMLKQCLRISVGTESENQRLLRRLQQWETV